MVWSFLWRFALGAALCLPLATRAAGFVVGLYGGGHQDARTAGFAAEVLVVILAFAFAAYDVRRLKKS